MNKGLKDYQPTSKDRQVAYSICKLKPCTNVMILEARTETKRITCETCGAEHVARYQDYFKSQ